jgi:hypothetical protein
MDLLLGSNPWGDDFVKDDFFFPFLFFFWSPNVPFCAVFIGSP